MRSRPGDLLQYEPLLVGLLVNPKVEGDRHEDVHRRASQPTGFEAPLTDRDDRLLVESLRIERSDDMNPPRTTVAIDDKFHDHRTLNLVQQGSGGISGLDLTNDSGGRDTSAWPI